MCVGQRQPRWLRGRGRRGLPELIGRERLVRGLDDRAVGLDDCRGYGDSLFSFAG
jgi:hypothetical protein